ncbi:MAG: ABC transporter ATP-binding protein, partial [Clostridia bacterium]
MQKELRTMKTSQLIGRFLPYFKKYIPILMLDLLCAGLTTLCDLVLPLIVKDITSYATTNLAALTVEYVL